jgi:hypothetical protein
MVEEMRNTPQQQIQPLFERKLLSAFTIVYEAPDGELDLGRGELELVADGYKVRLTDARQGGVLVLTNEMWEAPALDQEHVANYGRLRRIEMQNFLTWGRATHKTLSSATLLLKETDVCGVNLKYGDVQIVFFASGDELFHCCVPSVEELVADWGFDSEALMP